ncbi:adhesin [Proteus mirabilis]|uniref:hemagglutinin repeat-containing protein n=2 Tax=Proteus mirabilis TaxID=584 RepID=UPI0019D1E7DF|nr:hemagglutinin repeat-containing protein [Proteus mirabilis]MBI6485142.1 hemagglutinin repeat-containing protein [Proteus mirabilis]MBN7149522.1 adhesin [Proteus mirabilis]MBN7152666.1 adhesin [Proteus mirabilis]MBN7165429.1 adhesin [Proteus mirabilis]MBN7168850.1 adhesin [Proteus mirabilis]
MPIVEKRTPYRQPRQSQDSNPDSGNITVVGSELKAGKDLSLSATQDINLVSAQNTEQTTSQNSSKGSSVGVGMGVGEGGYGVNVSASVNQGKGHEKGNGLTHTETTLDAGNKLTLNSGQDTTLKGAQVSGEQVTVNVGRDLTLQSEQDSDRYDAKQQEVSVGGGYTIGGTPNINISASKDKIHSNYDSVKEQTGIFAGKGGFDANVKEHTQLDGAVIASTADKDKNRLDTGTLGWKDIDNKADFTAEHTGGSMGTGGPIGGQLLTNAAGGLLSNANNSGHTEGTTQSAVSDGSVIVRNEDKQKQDVNELNRDTEHANNGSINPIFDKEKEQNRLKQAQLIGEIGNQAMDIIRTEGDIAGYKAQKDPDALAIAKKQLEAAGKTPTEQAIKDQAYNNAMAQYGTGSDFQKAAQAVTGLLQGLAGDNLAGALANASSPYLATLIKQQVGEDNKAANAMAHAVLGAVVAELNNQSAAAGGLGAGGGELSAHVILNTLFPGKKVSDLTESEKQQVSALSQLASGLAGGLTTGDMAGAITGSQAGKNAVENNFFSEKDLPTGMSDYGSSAFTLGKTLEENGYTIDDINAALNKFSKGDHPEGQDPARGFLEAWGNMVGIPLDLFWSNEQMTPEKAAEILSGSPPTTTAKALQFTAAKAYLAFTKSGKGIPSWDAGKGEYSFKETGKVVDVKHPNNQFDGKNIYDAKGSASKNTNVPEETGSTLIFHENLGGHAIRRHVGKTDAQLLARFETEPRVLASSTFTDMKTADWAIGNGIAANQDKISTFMAGSDTRIVLNHESSTNIGRVIHKGQVKSVDSNKIVIVIDKDPLMPNGYRIQTAYPK